MDRVDTLGKVSLRYAGRLRHVGPGPVYATRRIFMLIHEQDIVITEIATGEILRELTLDPARDYQPRQKKTARFEDRLVTYVAIHP